MSTDRARTPARRRAQPAVPGSSTRAVARTHDECQRVRRWAVEPAGRARSSRLRCSGPVHASDARRPRPRRQSAPAIPGGTSTPSRVAQRRATRRGRLPRGFRNRARQARGEGARLRAVAALLTVRPREARATAPERRRAGVVARRSSCRRGRRAVAGTERCHRGCAHRASQPADLTDNRPRAARPANAHSSGVRAGDRSDHARPGIAMTTTRPTVGAAVLAAAGTTAGRPRGQTRHQHRSEPVGSADHTTVRH